MSSGPSSNFGAPDSSVYQVQPGPRARTPLGGQWVRPEPGAVWPTSAVELASETNSGVDTDSQLLASLAMEMRATRLGIQLLYNHISGNSIDLLTLAN